MLWQAHGIDHLVIPTRDYCFAPSLNDLCRAVEFIHGKYFLFRLAFDCFELPFTRVNTYVSNHSVIM